MELVGNIFLKLLYISFIVTTIISSVKIYNNTPRMLKSIFGSIFEAVLFNLISYVFIFFMVEMFICIFIKA